MRFFGPQPLKTIHRRIPTAHPAKELNPNCCPVPENFMTNLKVPLSRHWSPSVYDVVDYPHQSVVVILETWKNEWK